MKLEKFKDKEELINEDLYTERFDEYFTFKEIDFDEKEVYFMEEVRDYEYGWLDFKDRTFTFKELEEYNEGQLIKILIKKIKKL
jgi:hypothetical protein